MSLINQMLQDLDAQEGGERQPLIPAIAATAIKGRFIGLPSLLGMLLAAVLGAGVTWVLGQPKSGGLEGEIIPLALPALPVTLKRSTNPRPSAAALPAEAAGLSKLDVPGEISLGSKSKDPDPTGGTVEGRAETVVERQVPALQERSISRLVNTTERKPEPREIQSKPMGAKTTPRSQAFAALSSAVEQESGERQAEMRQSVKTVTRPHRIGGKKEVAPDPFRDAGLYLRQGRLADAEEALRRTLRVDPAMGQAREMLAALLLRDGRQIEAATLLDQGLQLEPEQPVFLSLRARLYREQGDAGKAIALLLQGLRDDRDNADLLALLGVLYQEEKRFSEASAVYRRLLKQHPGSAKSWAGLAISLDAAGEQATALQAYRRALANNQLSKEVAEYARQRVSVLESQ